LFDLQEKGREGGFRVFTVKACLKELLTLKKEEARGSTTIYLKD